MRDTAVSIDEWKRQRAIQTQKQDAPLPELGFSTFFLNRTNRSGIIASGGVIGGNRQTGRWKIDARYNRSELVRRIERIAEYRDRISIYNEDAEDFLGIAAGTLPERSLVYLDPPYYVKGRQRLYASYYQDDDHSRIAEVLESCPWRWVVSYDAAPEILSLYKPYSRALYSLRYTAAGSYEGDEAMFFSPDVRLPHPSIVPGTAA